MTMRINAKTNKSAQKRQSSSKPNLPNKKREIKEEGLDDKPERIAKRMARAGLCSRRDAERWIAEGRVKLNGKELSSPAQNVKLADKIEVDGEQIRARERTRLWLYNKPAGLLSTNKDPEGRPTLFDKLPKDVPRLLSVGRLDMNTEGLLLMTNDGGLARILELPSTGWLRRYRVRAHGKIDTDKIEGLKDGIAVDGVLYGAVEAELERQQGHNNWLRVAIREGKNREVKNVLGAIGLEVNRLIRISYGPFQLGDLPSGELREIKGRTLRQQLGERLIELADADFETPVIAPKKSPAEKISPKTVRNKKFVKKIPRGAIAPGTMERLKTQKKPGMAEATSTKNKSKRRHKK